MAQSLGLFYVPEGFDTGQAKLMGRHAAGEGFLQGLARHGGLDALYCYTRTPAMADEFKTRYGSMGGDAGRVRPVPFDRPDALQDAGTLFLPGPGIDAYAWTRRRFSQRAYSLTGVTHTTASEAVMQTAASLLTAPVQAWDAVICTSQVVRDTFNRIFEAHGDYLARRFAMPAPKPAVRLPVIPLGVDSGAFARTAETGGFRSAWRERIGAGPDDTVVLFVGRLSFHAKAHPHPMYAALEKAARETGNTVHLVQAGWFANEHIQKAFTEGARLLAPGVRHHFLDGRKPEVRRQIWFAADIFCSLSDNIQETFGLTPVEAMAAGLPQVVSDWNGYKETVRHEVDGFRIPTLAVEPGAGDELALRYEVDADNYDIYCGNACNAVSVDAEAAAQAFIRLIEDPALRRRMGEAAAARARDAFDWRVVIAAYHALWDELAELRATAPEIAPLQPGEPPHPFRQDPFALFATYPSRTLGDATALFPAPGAGEERLNAIRGMGMHQFGLRLPPEVLTGMLGHIVDGPGMTVHELEGRFADLPPGRLRRALVWLDKVGLIRAEG